MTTKQPYPEEFKIEAVKQITQRGHRVADVSTRIGVSQHSLYKWIKAHAGPVSERQSQQTSSTEELRRLKAELKRVSEERDLLKKAAAYFARQSG
jgi:transposase